MDNNTYVAIVVDRNEWAIILFEMCKTHASARDSIYEWVVDHWDDVEDELGSIDDHGDTDNVITAYFEIENCNLWWEIKTIPGKFISPISYE
jgi:hypothetical protein